LLAGREWQQQHQSSINLTLSKPTIPLAGIILDRKVYWNYLEFKCKAGNHAPDFFLYLFFMNFSSAGCSLIMNLNIIVVLNILPILKEITADDSKPVLV
jgi:hypothetical protein